MDNINNNHDIQNHFLWDVNNLEEGFLRLKKCYEEDPRILEIAIDAICDYETTDLKLTIEEIYEFVFRMGFHFVKDKEKNFSYFDLKGPKNNYKYLLSPEDTGNEDANKLVIGCHRRLLLIYVDFIDACMEVNPHIVSCIKINTWFFQDEKMMLWLEKQPTLIKDCWQHLEAKPLQKTQKEMLPLVLFNKKNWKISRLKALPKPILHMIFSYLFLINRNS